MVKRLVLVSLAAAFILPVVIGQDESFGDKVRQLLAEGTDLYNKGKYPEASSKFEEAFQMKPSSDQVYAFIKRAGEQMIGKMMNDPDRKIQDIGRRLMELAKPGEPLREGKAVVLKYVEDLKSDDHAIWRNAFWHLKNFGPWSVRFLMPALADQQQDRFRSRVMLLFTDMGIDCSLAVIEALDSKNPFVRQNAAICLGNIKDERAIAALKRVSEDANEPAEVKKFANEALLKIIRGKEPGQWKKATDYYYELAMKYYYSHSSVIHSFQRHYLIWKWDTEKDVLTERKVARMSYNEQLAEEALYDLLTLDPNYADKATSLSAWSLLACVHFAEAIESKAAVEAALQALRYDEIDKPGLTRMIRDIEGLSDASIKDLGGKIEAAAAAADVEKIVNEYFARQAKIIRANVLGELPGKRFIYEALSRSLADGNYLVAKSCIETIQEMGKPEDLPSPPLPEGSKEADEKAAGTGSASNVSGTMGYPLIEALTNEDKRVRYAAANAMVAINPQRRKLGMELVIPNLIDAIGEQGVRVALVIYDVQDDNDRNFINGFRKLLTSINVFPVIVTSGDEGIIKAKQFPTQDVVIIQKKICGRFYFKESDTKKPIEETIFDTLRDDVRTKSIARIVLGDTPEEVNAANKEFLEKGTAQGVIDKAVHKLDLQALFDKIFDSDKNKKDSKDRADLIAKAAAETLASIDPTNTLYPYRDAVEALIKTVSPEILREDFIRIPAARALGRYGDQRAVDVLAKVVSDKDADAERAARQKGVRWQCGKSLSQIFKQTGITPSAEVFEVLKKNTKDGDYDIEVTCGEALGNATLTNPQRLDLSKFRRIERESYTAEDP
jgi:HEAT repeat protein